MAWNEPGGDKDPWGNQGGRRGQEGPPDLDKVIRDMQRRFSSLFGGGKGGNGGGGGNGAAFGLVFAGVLAVWLASGFYQVDEAERGVVMQFGDYAETTMPGLHWHMPWPIETVETVNVASIDEYEYKTEMLTRDENIVSIAISVQYRRADPQAFLFNVRNPEMTLEDVTDSAVREVVGKNTMDFVLGEGREEITNRTRELVQSTLETYGTGIEITSVNLQDANFPRPVQPAVQDAIKAREDKERFELEAQAYANDVVPRARGQAARRIEAAEAYKQEVIANAEGQTARFTALLREYKKAPGVTRERLFLETMEQILGSTNKVLVSADGSGNLMVLPLQEMLKNAGMMGSGSDSTESSPTNSSTPSTEERDRESARDRGARR
ncbi:MAG: FtsH protease activity modulator HflK [Gammaproteobacteria bacterium]|nr:FtsH protease activity modulator HflK [Gammaproteobacteria bacterium]